MSPTGLPSQSRFAELRGSWFSSIGLLDAQDSFCRSFCVYSTASCRRGYRAPLAMPLAFTCHCRPGLAVLLVLLSSHTWFDVMFFFHDVVSKQFVSLALCPLRRLCDISRLDHAKSGSMCPCCDRDCSGLVRPHALILLGLNSGLQSFRCSYFSITPDSPFRIVAYYWQHVPVQHISCCYHSYSGWLCGHKNSPTTPGIVTFTSQHDCNL